MSTTASTQYEVGTIVHVAPGRLLMERNIRNATPDKAMVQSIAHVGVLEPITAVTTPTGDLMVRYGHRRTLAAIAAEQDTVPVYVAGTDSTENKDEIHRLITQRDENTHRSGLTTSDEVGIVEQLTLLGLTAAQVAKQARIPRVNVDTALTVSTSSLARKAAERYETLSLDQAATVADFDDEPEVAKALILAAHEGQFDHAAQRARNDRAEAKATAAILTTLETEGTRVIDRPNGYDSTAKRLTELKANHSSTERLSPTTHATCPGHVAWVGSAWVRVGADGETIHMPTEPEDEADEATWDAYRQERERAEAISRSAQRPAAVYGCENPAKHGHADPYKTNTHDKPKAADMSDGERSKAKEERALVIESNKAWTASESVRREWLATFAKTKTPPKGTGAFLATSLCKDHALIDAVGGNALAAEWLKVKHTGYGWADLSPTKSATENRALVLALVQVLAAYEAAQHKGSWRHDGTHNDTGRYLRFLQTCGYVLSDVEKYAISKQTA